MQTVICLGPKACDIGELFEKDSDFQVKLIDKEIEGDNCFGLVKQKPQKIMKKAFQI